MKNIVIVDEHVIFRESLKFFIENENLGNVIELIDNSVSLNDVFLHYVVDLVILDISSTSILTFDFITSLITYKPEVKILVLSMSNNKLLINDMKLKGVCGFVLISAGKNELQSAITTVLNNGKYFAGEIIY